MTLYEKARENALMADVLAHVARVLIFYGMIRSRIESLVLKVSIVVWAQGYIFGQRVKENSERQKLSPNLG